MAIGCCIAIATLSPARSANNPDPVKLFEFERSAVGGTARDHLGEIVESGTIVGQGQRSPYITFVNSRTGWSKTITRLVTGTVSNGFDGGVPWSQSNGSVEVYNGPVNLKAERAQTYVARNGWWRPGEDPATFTYVRREPGSKHGDDVVRVTPSGGDSLLVRLDVTTHFIDSIAETDDANQITITTYDDYRMLDGIVYPFSTTSSQGDATYTQHAYVSAVHFMTRLVDLDLRRPVTTRSGSLSGLLSTSIPFDVDAPQGGHIIIVGRIDGSRPLHLIFDTGGSNSLTPEAARTLHLRGIGNLPIGDAGGAQVSSQIAKVRTLNVGAAKLHDQSFAIVPMSSTIVDAGSRYRIDGLVGSEILDNFVVSIDRISRTLTLTDPAAFRPRRGGVALRFVSDGQPLIQAALNGVPGLFLFDTGNPSVSEVPSHFLRAHFLEKLLSRNVPIVTGGLKSKFSASLIRVKRFAIGPYVLKNVPFAVTDTVTGPLAAQAYAGLLGEEILSEFTVMLDYTRSTIYLKPNRDFNRWIAGNRTGLSITVPERGQLLVVQVIPDGPAARSGMRIGDLIVAVNGKPAIRSSFAALAQGMSMDVTFLRGDVRLRRRLNLRELLQ